MSYNDYMYAIDRSDEYLAHYGIKGMKWGVRKAIESGNSKKLDRAYRKASKKLAKLEKRANSGSKYARRAAALGAGAAAAGGLAAVGTSGVSKALGLIGRRGVDGSRSGAAISKAVNNWGKSTGIASSAKTKAFELAGKHGLIPANISTAGHGVVTRAREAVRRGGPVNVAGVQNNPLANTFMRNQASKIANTPMGAAARGNPLTNTPFRQNAIANASKNPLADKVIGSSGSRGILDGKGRKSGITNNDIARVGAAALGLGLAGAAGYNAYRAATTKRAARKAAEFKSEMNKAFAGTKYANGGANKSSGNRKRRRH